MNELLELIEYKTLSVKKEKFGNINLSDSFFDSLKEDYIGFEEWFCKKADNDAYITISSDAYKLLSFLYLKVEDKNENYSNINPPFKPKKRLKVGTFKVIDNGVRLGERFLKIIFDHAIKYQVDEIYVTIFDKREEQRRLIDLLKLWGFVYWGKKRTELVYVRDFTPKFDKTDLKGCYPYISKSANIYIVPIYEEYHTSLFPDSILNTESPIDFIENCPYQNCIDKVYVSRAYPPHPKHGDILVFYRTGGYYKSVITTIGVVNEIIYSFSSEDDFLKYCRKRTVYSDEELHNQWIYKGIKPFVIDFLYVYSFIHRINMKSLIDLEILKDLNDAPRGFKQISKAQFELIIKETKSDESLIVD